MPYLVSIVDERLAHVLAAVPGALIAPLGRVATECVEYHARAVVADMGQLFVGMPHPSGRNEHPTRQYDERREEPAAVIAKFTRRA